METEKIREYAKILREMDLTALEIKADGSLRLERSADSLNNTNSETVYISNKNKMESADISADIEVVSSPMVGMVYIAPAENAEPFVHIGDLVHKGDVLCIIEAMKLMNEITAETDGIISEIQIVNGAVVEYGQPLFKLRKE